MSEELLFGNRLREAWHAIKPLFQREEKQRDARWPADVTAEELQAEIDRVYGVTGAMGSQALDQFHRIEELHAENEKLRRDKERLETIIANPLWRISNQRYAAAGGNERQWCIWYNGRLLSHSRDLRSAIDCVIQ